MITNTELVFILLKLFLYECLDGINAESIQTSASVVENTSSIPTIFRRNTMSSLDTDNSEERKFLNPGEGLSARRAKQDNYVWKWDEWCQYQPQVGSCVENITRYYYNTAMEKCLKFQFSGCNANKNNFETSLDCERYCKSNGYIFDENHIRPSLCYYQPDAGMCIAFLKKYYYDINERTCKKFVYGGCGGNYNRFDTLFSCMEACQKYE